MTLTTLTSKTTAVATVLMLAFASVGSAQTPAAQRPSETSGGTGGGTSAGAPSGGAKGNSPPGTPSWGSARNPTAPCPAGTTRQNLGQDCKPLDQQGKQPPGQQGKQQKPSKND